MTEPESTPTPPPGWQAPKQRRTDVASLVVGLVILGIGLWYFLDTTLGFTMPSISWDTIWPLLLILIGGVILFRAAADRRR